LTGRTATPALIGATVAVSFSAIFIRIANDDAATIVWLRMALTTVLLAPWALRAARHHPLFASRRDAALTACAGVFLAAHFLLWTASLRYTTIAASVLLVSLHPLIVAPLGSRLLGERVSARTAAGIVIALAGTAVTCAGDVRLSTAALVGDLLAIGGAIALSAYLLIGRGLRAAVSVSGYSMSVYGVVAIIAAATAAVSGNAHLPDARVVLLCLALAVVCTLGGHTVYNWSLRRVPAVTVSLAFLGEPPLTALLGVIILAAIPSLPTVIGGVVILAGLALVLSESAQRSRAPAPLAVE
jgi:drug/metabolite transporter (DMT)-like permease